MRNIYKLLFWDSCFLLFNNYWWLWSNPQNIYLLFVLIRWLCEAVVCCLQDCDCPLLLVKPHLDLDCYRQWSLVHDLHDQLGHLHTQHHHPLGDSYCHPQICWSWCPWQVDDRQIFCNLETIFYLNSLFQWAGFSATFSTLLQFSSLCYFGQCSMRLLRALLLTSIFMYMDCRQDFELHVPLQIF